MTIMLHKFDHAAALSRKMLAEIDKEICELKALHELADTAADRQALGTELQEWLRLRDTVRKEMEAI